MALISDQALMRHQYQRRMSTSPRPADAVRMSPHAPAIVSSCVVTRMPMMARRNVTTRDTFT